MMSFRKLRRIDFIGAPVGIGGNHEGTALGPATLRITGLVRRLSALGIEVHDRGDVTPNSDCDLEPNMNLRNTEAVANWARVISQETYSALKQGALPIVAGGDHSVSFGSVNGVARYHREQGNELFVLWLDAHADFNTPAISPTGNAHGMSAAFACGEPGLDEIIAREERVSIEPQNLFLFGTRWIDPKEQVLLGERSVNVFDMNTLDMSGVPLILSRIINTVKAREGVLHVSFDLDLLDPETAPGVGTPEAGGIAFREARLIMEMLHDSGLVGSIDLVELNPLLDHRNSSAKVLVELVCSLFGHKLFDPSAESLTREGAASERYGR